MSSAQLLCAALLTHPTEARLSARDRAVLDRAFGAAELIRAVRNEPGRGPADQSLLDAGQYLCTQLKEDFDYDENAQEDFLSSAARILAGAGAEHLSARGLLRLRWTLHPERNWPLKGGGELAGQWLKLWRELRAEQWRTGPKLEMMLFNDNVPHRSLNQEPAALNLDDPCRQLSGLQRTGLSAACSGLFPSPLRQERLEKNLELLGDLLETHGEMTADRPASPVGGRPISAASWRAEKKEQRLYAAQNIEVCCWDEWLSLRTDGHPALYAHVPSLRHLITQGQLHRLGGEFPQNQLGPDSTPLLTPDTEQLLAAHLRQLMELRRSMPGQTLERSLERL